MFKLHLLVLHLTSVTLSVLNSSLFEGVVVTAIILKFFIEEVNNLITGDIEKLSSVRDNNNSALAVTDIILEPHHSVQVEMVGGLIQKEHLGLDKESSS